MRAIKKVGILVMLFLLLCVSFCSCKSDKSQEKSEGLAIEEDMIYEDGNSSEDSGKPYDKDGDGFVDGWY